MFLACDPVKDFTDCFDFLMVRRNPSPHQSVWSRQSVKKVYFDRHFLLFQKFSHGIKT